VKLYPKVVPLVFFVLLFSLCSAAWGSVPFQDDIGACLSQADGSRISLPCEEIYKVGRSGRSFAIKEFGEPQPNRPRLAVVSTQPLPVSSYWTCDLTGVLSSFSRNAGDGTTTTQRVLVVSPENVLIYCDQKGRPFLFPPIKGLGIEWPNKRSLAAIAGDSGAVAASVSAMEEAPLPPMPDALESGTPPYDCSTIADAKGLCDTNGPVMVTLQCCPFSGATSTGFTLGQDDPADNISVWYSGSASLGTGRINKLIGTIKKDASNNYWIEVDSGPSWTDTDTVGSVQIVPEGSIAWAKTFGDGLSLSATLSGKVVSRTFPSLGCFYVQEPARAGGIRVNDSASAETLHVGDIVTISSGELTTVDGERAINYPYTQLDSSGEAPKPLALNNKALGGGDFNSFTKGPVGGVGLNNVGLLVRAWGKVTATGSGYFYIDDGSNPNDGSGATGARVEGSIDYMPDIDDYVAVNVISGLKTTSGNLARVLRIASGSDFTPVTPAKPDAPEVYATSASTIRLYWGATPGATGYNIYRSETSGDEDYNSPPLNGSTPVTALTYQDTGLTEGVEYFYTIKAISGSGVSQPSDENSAVPYADAIPWGGSVYDVTNAIQARVNGYADYIRVCGPDGTIYDSTQSTPQPPDGTVDENTYLFTHSSGQVFPVTHDTWSSDTDSSMLDGSQMTASGWTPQLFAPSDGVYRRVSTKQQSGYYYFGVAGNFVLPDRNGISLRGDKTTPYIYMGSHVAGLTYGPKKVDVDAGLMWNRNFLRNTWDAYMLTNTAGKKTFGRARVNWGLGSNYRFMAGTTVNMAYWISMDTSILVISGFDEYFNYKQVIVANAYGAIWYPAATMKRAHSFATGHAGVVRDGSYVWGEEVSDTMLYHFKNDGSTEAVWWTPDCTPSTGEWGSGSNPAKGNGIDWRETNPYIAEDRIYLGP